MDFLYMEKDIAVMTEKKIILLYLLMIICIDCFFKYWVK
jgi:hypothetical protein